MKVDRRGGALVRRVGSCILGVTMLLGVTLAFGVATTSTRSRRGRTEKLPGHRAHSARSDAGRAGPVDDSLAAHAYAQAARPLRVGHGGSAVVRSEVPEYRHFLTPTQFAQEFGPTRATIAQVTSSLREEGLTVGTPSATRLSLPVSGSVAQVQSAFSTRIAKYRLSSGRTGYDNATAPEVSSSVAPQIQGILGSTR